MACDEKSEAYGLFLSLFVTHKQHLPIGMRRRGDNPWYLSWRYYYAKRLRTNVLVLRPMTRIERFSVALHDYTALVHAQVLPEIKALQHTLRDEPYVYNYTVLHKLNSALGACAFLMKEVGTRRHFSDSIFLILRASISDSLMFCHILNKSDGNHEKMNALIKSLYFDHYDYAFKDPELVSAVRGVTLAEVEAEILELKTDNPEFFDGGGKPRVPSWKTSVRTTLKFAVSNDVDPNLRQFMKNMFGYYELFSKYEHFGFMTFSLTHRHERTEELEKVPFQIMDSIINLIIPTYGHAIALWPDVKQRYQQSFVDHINGLVGILEEKPGFNRP